MNRSELIKTLEEYPLAFGLYYFPHHFRINSPVFHLVLLREVINNLLLAIAAPRESSKTTILGFLYPMLTISLKKKRFIVVLASVYTKACGILDAMKYEVKNNQLLRSHFSLTLVRDAEGDSIFRHPDGYEVRVLCKGRDQIGDVRGEKFGAYRPDLIICDDVEDDKMVVNPERRQELQDLFDNVIMFAGEKGITQIIWIGTMLHDDSQLAKLISKDKYTNFRKLFYKARLDETNPRQSLWEEKWTVEELDAMEKRDPSSFAKEMQNDPVSGLQAKFTKEDFRYWKIDNMQYVLFDKEGGVISRDDLSKCKAAIACDLAWDEKRDSDFSVILPAFLTPNSDLLVDSYICKKGMRPNELEEILFSMEERLRSITGHSVFVGFEKAKLEKVMKWLLKGAMRERNKFLIFKELQWDGDKIQRIVTRLQPRYAQHVVYHKSGMGDLEYQLLRIPSGTHDDLPDALQGVVQLLEYPKQGAKPKEAETEFDWLRKLAIEKSRPSNRPFAFGRKAFRRNEIPALRSFR